MWELLRRFRSLGRDSRRVLVRAALLLPLISVSLNIRGFRRTHATLRQFLRNSNAEGAGAEPEMTARMVRAAARYVPVHGSCLEQSLVLWFLLRREGIASELRIGARKSASGFEAHAWIECRGKALNETQEVHRHYAAFDQALGAAEAL